MTNILINYNNINSTADCRTDIAGTDSRGLWCALLVEKIKKTKHLKVLFPRDTTDEQIAIEVDVNAHPIEKKSKKRIGLFMETPEIYYKNNADNLQYYNYVITSDETIHDNNKTIYSELPCWDANAISKEIKLNKFENTYSMICGNKKFRRKISSEDLYRKRRKIIKYFETNNPKNFHLYGPGWDINPLTIMYPRIGNNLRKMKVPGGLKCYRGICLEKSKVIKNYCYNFCMENCTYPNYVSEKYFDAVLNGAVPIYYSNREIVGIDPGSFVNAYNFHNIENLVSHCNSLSLEERRNIISIGQENLYNLGLRYTHQNYANNIYSAIEKCL